MPTWLVPILVELGTKLVGYGIEALKDKVEDTPTKVDDTLVNIVDKIVEHKVKQSGTAVTAKEQTEIIKLISKITE